MGGEGGGFARVGDGTRIMFLSAMRRDLIEFLWSGADADADADAGESIPCCRWPRSMGKSKSVQDLRAISFYVLIKKCRLVRMSI